MALAIKIIALVVLCKVLTVTSIPDGLSNKRYHEGNNNDFEVVVVSGEVSPTLDTRGMEIFSLANGRHEIGMAQLNLSHFGSALDQERDTAYFVGGYNPGYNVVYNVFLAYNARHKTWARLPLFPFFTTGNAVVVYDHQVYSLGGYLAGEIYNTYVYNANVDDNLSDQQNRQWKQLGKLPAQRHDHCAVVVDKSFYYIGGTWDNGFLADVFRSDDKARSWTAVDELNVGRTHAACVAVDRNSILVAGGTVDDSTATDSVEVYDASSDTWRTMQPMLNARRGARAIVLPNTRDVLVCGGDDAQGEYFDSCEVYDWVENEWRESNERLHTARSHFGMFVVKQQYNDGAQNNSYRLATTDSVL